MSIKICACIMAKNESAVIQRLLDSCKDIIYSLSLTDTGSSDNTIELAEEWCKTNNILIKVYRDPWINFGVSRTKSLNNANEAFPDADYYLLLDCDMVLRIFDGHNSDKLKHDEIRLYQYNTGTKYANTRLVSRKKYFRSVGCTHEYWSSPMNISRGDYNHIAIDDLNDGGSRHDKHERDKRLLLEGMRKGVTPDYLLGRYAFYLGQTYQCCNYELSNYWFNRKIELGGWCEETYYSYYQIAENHRRAKNYEKAIFYAFKALDVRCGRAEPILLLVQCFKALGMKNMAKMYIDMGMKIKGTTDILFIDVGCYDGSKFIEELNNLNISHH